MFYDSSFKEVNKYIFCNLTISLNHIDNVYEYFKRLLGEENSLSEIERTILYSYGIEKIQIDLVRLVNIKKALKSIMENKKIPSEP